MATLLPNLSTYTNATVGQYLLSMNLENLDLDEHLQYPDAIAKLLESPFSHLKKILFSQILYVVNENHLHLLLQQQYIQQQQLRDAFIDFDTEASHSPKETIKLHINDGTINRLRQIEAELKKLQLEQQNKFIELRDLEELELKVLVYQSTRTTDLFTEQKQKLLTQIDIWLQQNPNASAKITLIEDIKEQLHKEEKTLSEVIEKIKAHGVKVKDREKVLIFHSNVMQELRLTVCLKKLVKEGVITNEDAKLLRAAHKTDFDKQTQERQPIIETRKKIYMELNRILEQIKYYVTAVKDENLKLGQKPSASQIDLSESVEDLEIKTKKAQNISAAIVQVSDSMESALEVSHMTTNNASNNLEQAKQIKEEISSPHIPKQ